MLRGVAWTYNLLGLDPRLFDGLSCSADSQRDAFVHENVVKFLYRGRIGVIHHWMVRVSDR